MRTEQGRVIQRSTYQGGVILISTDQGRVILKVQCREW